MSKTVVVTGATNGTGYAIARRFACEGYNVCITSRSAENARIAAEQLAAEFEEIKTFGYGLEVKNEEQVVAMFDELKAADCMVDALVMNAANMGLAMDDYFDMKFEDWWRVIETNLGWNFMFAREAARHMKEKGKGAIVAIGSITAVRSIKNRSAYTVSKSALHGLARALAIELAPYGIRTNTLVAGTIKTARWHANPMIKFSPHSKNPMLDSAEFEDIANGAYFLCSDQARFINGIEMPVDGGMLAQMCYEEKGLDLRKKD